MLPPEHQQAASRSVRIAVILRLLSFVLATLAFVMVLGPGSPWLPLAVGLVTLFYGARFVSTARVLAQSAAPRRRPSLR